MVRAGLAAVGVGLIDGNDGHGRVIGVFWIRRHRLARSTVEEERASHTSLEGITMVANTTFDAQVAEAERRLARKRQTLADTDMQANDDVVLLREANKLEREVAALH